MSWFVPSLIIDWGKEYLTVRYVHTFSVPYELAYNCREDAAVAVSTLNGEGAL